MNKQAKLLTRITVFLAVAGLVAFFTLNTVNAGTSAKTSRFETSSISKCDGEAKAATDKKEEAKEAKCGEGKTDVKKTDAKEAQSADEKTDAKKADAKEAKCGEGKTDVKKTDAKEAKCGEGKTDAKKAEGQEAKCGEGKCGEGKCG